MLSNSQISIMRKDRAVVQDMDASTPGLSPQTVAAGTAHDLGNLIQIASSSLNRLARDPKVSTSDLGPIIAAGTLALDKASQMVRQRVDRSRSPDPVEPRVDVRACMRDLDVLFRSTWEPRRFAIELHLEAGLPEARCDRQGLENALLNLVLNARDAMPDGGIISVHAVAVWYDGEPMIELRVADRGVGMTQETMLRAFEPFFTTKGTGLGGVGLPMVRHFVEGHGGTVRLESAPAVGTTVVMQLPAAARLEKTAASSNPDAKA